MDRVTYILGAGFSAPLGIPVMRDFYSRSRDLYDVDPQKYAYFREVFDAVDRLSVIKNYYRAPLLNVEEILSIIEMRSFLEESDLGAQFLRYLSDVVLHYTPSFRTTPSVIPENWHASAFGNDEPLSCYAWFVASLFNLELGKFADSGIRWLWAQPSQSPPAQYAVITLNYDAVLESVCAFINNNYRLKVPLEFNQGGPPARWEAPCLAKLHGSADSGIVVPPTWAKGRTRDVAPAWQLAYHILKESSSIRFIGYSLPGADAYVKYLIKSAVGAATHLKAVDAICRDTDRSARGRYKDFIEFHDFRFAAADVTDYLRHLRDRVRFPQPPMRDTKPFKIDALEEAHADFMAKHKEAI